MKAPPGSLKVGALWIGGADDFVLEILGNGHRRGLKLVRQYDVGNGTAQEFNTAGNLIAKRNDWAGTYTEDLRQLLPKHGCAAWLKVREIRKQIAANCY